MTNEVGRRTRSGYDRPALQGTLFLMAAAAAMLPGEIGAQESASGPGPTPTIASDRPGLGDGAHVLAEGVWQLEAGVAYDGGGPATLFSAGQALVRVGLAGLELRFYPNSVVFQRGDVPHDEGIQDVGAGVKLALSPDDADLRTAVVAGATLPTGGDAFTANEVTAWGTFVLERALSEEVGLAVNVGYGAPLNGFGEGTLTVIVTPGFAVPDAEGMSVYAGYAGFFSDGGDSHVVEAGLAYLADADTQLDLNTGWDPDAGTWFLGVGVARRWR
jgi:hypothetical protein